MVFWGFGLDWCVLFDFYFSLSLSVSSALLCSKFNIPPTEHKIPVVLLSANYPGDQRHPVLGRDTVF